MMENAFRIGSVVGTRMIATFQATSYARKLLGGVVQNSVKCNAFIHVGTVDSLYIAASKSGIQDTFSDPNGVPVPAGFPIYVVWDVVGTANARLSWDLLHAV